MYNHIMIMIAIEVMFKDKDKIADIIEFHEKTLRIIRVKRSHKIPRKIYMIFSRKLYIRNTDISTK